MSTTKTAAAGAASSAPPTPSNIAFPDLDCIGAAGFSLTLSERTALKTSLKVLLSNYLSMHPTIQAPRTARFWGKIFGVQNDYLVAQIVPSGSQALQEMLDVELTYQNKKKAEEKAAAAQQQAAEQGGAAAPPPAPLTFVPTGFYADTPTVSFFSVDGGVNWTLLPCSTEDQRGFCEQLRGRFFGNPNFEYKLRKDIPPPPEVPSDKPQLPDGTGDIAVEPEEGEDGAEGEGAEGEEAAEGAGAEETGEEDPEAAAAAAEEAKKKRKPKLQILSLKESTRVACFVEAHDLACSIVIRGNWLQKSGGGKNLVVCERNKTFQGLDLAQSMKYISYLKIYSSNVTKQYGAETAADGGEEHLSLQAQNSIVYGPTYHPPSDFLAPITQDTPSGVWTVKYDPVVDVVLVQNLYFEGSVFYHRPISTTSAPNAAGSSIGQQVYFGSGERNLDLCFVLP